MHPLRASHLTVVAKALTQTRVDHGVLRDLCQGEHRQDGAEDNDIMCTTKIKIMSLLEGVSFFKSNPYFTVDQTGFNKVTELLWYMD